MTTWVSNGQINPVSQSQNYTVQGPGRGGGRCGFAANWVRDK